MSAHSGPVPQLTRFIRVACSNMLLLLPTVPPTHSNVLVRVSRSYDRNMLEHVGVCDANKSTVNS